jgi:regulator of nonsense transcripts 2
MKNQQQAEREEQQRIKNLVLNLDLGENETEDGECIREAPSGKPLDIHTPTSVGHYDNKPAPYHHNRGERQGKDRNAQRSRKLQLSDVDWYDRETFRQLEADLVEDDSRNMPRRHFRGRRSGRR